VIPLPRGPALVSVLAAVLAGLGSLVGLLEPDLVYGREQTVLADAATAQDAVNLLVVVPSTLALAALARRGSWRAWTCWLGCVAFSVYNYAIYVVAIQLGVLFLLWVVVLGLSSYALATGVAAGLRERGAVTPDRRDRAVAWYLLVAATSFALLWLSEIVPDVLAARPSTSAQAWDVPTNPVHVLDLALFLPALVLTAVALLRGRPFGRLTAGGQLVWLSLTSLPILLTPVVSQARGHEAGWAVLGPIGAVLIVTLSVLVAALDPRGDPHDGDPAEVRDPSLTRPRPGLVDDR